eukprot:2000631-Rhodomonas_salina.3
MGRDVRLAVPQNLSKRDSLCWLEVGTHATSVRAWPKGGPGMPEMLTPTSAIVGAGLSQDVALITDGRFSG